MWHIIIIVIDDGSGVSVDKDYLDGIVESCNNILQVIINDNISSSVMMMTRNEAAIVCNCDTSHYPELVRVISVGGLSIPCGGTHLKSTGEFGKVKITKIRKKKNIVKISYAID